MLTTTFFMFLFLRTGGWTRFPILMVLGFTALSVTPVVMAIVQENVPENRALANGIYMALNFTIQSGAVVLVGALGDLFGLRLAFTVSAITPLLGLPFVFMLPRRRL
jgi:FSR family fosmidomycin resistance protein-like MFS transporter